MSANSLGCTENLSLPVDVREKLAELELELSEGKTTIIYVIV